MFRTIMLASLALTALAINLLFMYAVGAIFEGTPNIDNWKITKAPYFNWALIIYCQYWMTYYYDEWSKRIL